MMIRSIMNVKGGIGKTTTAIQLAAGLGKAGRKTLIVDADGQGTCTLLLLPDKDFNSDEDYAGKTLGGTLLGTYPIEECIWGTDIPNVDIIPSNLDLFNTIYELQSNSINGLPQFKLKQMLRSLDYDEIVIDNNPSINMMSVNSIYAADELIIPTCPDVGGLAGVQMTLNHAAMVIKDIDRDARIDYHILFTLVNRNNLERQTISKFREIYGDHIFRQPIRYQANPVKHANFSNTLLIDDMQANVSADYRRLINEVLGKNIEQAGDEE